MEINYKIALNNAKINFPEKKYMDEVNARKKAENELKEIKDGIPS